MRRVNLRVKKSSSHSNFSIDLLLRTLQEPHESKRLKMSPPEDEPRAHQVKSQKGKAPAGYRLLHVDDDDDDEGDLKLQVDQEPQRRALEKMVEEADTPIPGPAPPANSSGVLETDFSQRLESFLGQNSYQNVRPYQEDRTAFKVYGEKMIHIGLFDGHAGSSTSSFLQEHLLSELCMHMEKGSGTKTALEKSFIVINNELRSFQSSYFCGSTGTVVVLDGRQITSAGCGDSPAFLVSTQGKATPLTIDHNPNTHEEERLRVISAGGRVQKMNFGERNKRVLSFDNLSGLAMTRAFGDFNFPGVIANPHVIETEIEDDSLFLVVASDGLTEQWTIKGAAEDCLELHKAGLNPREIAEQLTHKAVDRGSRDNISIVVLNVQRFLTTDLFEEPTSKSQDDECADDDSDNGSLGLALSMY